MLIPTRRHASRIYQDAHYLRLKRLLDIIITLLLLLPLCICIAFIAVCIRLDSPGLIFFRQRRIGIHGQPFSMYKFRSMYEHSDETIHKRDIELYMQGQSLSEAGVPFAYKRSNDPRVTRIGKLLRRTSLDELPQFINVLKGEMSLVGPRPPLPYEVERYNETDHLRLEGKPGLTGPWQIYGRSRVPFHVMVEMDIAYLRRQSLREDLKLIGLTTLIMLRGDGGA